MVFLVFWDSIPKRCKGVHCVDLGESFPTLLLRLFVQIFIFQSLPMSLFSISFRTDSYSNEYLLAKIGVDTAENEPLEVWGENSIQYSLHSLVETF